MPVKCRWVTPTLDDYMFDIAQDTWWGRKEKAKERLIWLMKWMKQHDGEEYPEEKDARVGESEENSGETREDGVVCA